MFIDGQWFTKQDFTDTMRDIRENYYVPQSQRERAAEYARRQVRDARADRLNGGSTNLDRVLTLQDWADGIERETARA